MRRPDRLGELNVEVAQLRNDNGVILQNINDSTQIRLILEAENSILRSQISELMQMLNSLNEIIHFFALEPGATHGQIAGINAGNDFLQQSEMANQLNMELGGAMLPHAAIMGNEGVETAKDPLARWLQCKHARLVRRQKMHLTRSMRLIGSLERENARIEKRRKMLLMKIASGTFTRATTWRNRSCRSTGISGEIAVDNMASSSNLQLLEPRISSSAEFGSSSFGSDFAEHELTNRSFTDFFPPPSYDFSASTDSKSVDQGGSDIIPAHNEDETTQEIGSAKPSEGARSLPMIGYSKITVPIQSESSSHSQQSVTVVHEVNRENVSRGQDDATRSRKRSLVMTLDREYGISREILDQHSGKKLVDVADILGVSRSTLKRVCRKHNISRWPPFKEKNHKRLRSHQEFTRGNLEENSENSSLRNLQDFNDSAGKASSKASEATTLKDDGNTASDAATFKDDSSIFVKAKYRDDIIKFEFPISSRKKDLEIEVAMRLNLSLGSFSIKYLDEENEWVLVTCDADLRTGIRISRSLGKTTIRMSVVELPWRNSKSD